MQKLSFILLFVLSALCLNAAEKPLFQFDRLTAPALPSSWYINKQAYFVPAPKIEYPMADGVKVMKISEVKGKEGCRIDCYKHWPAKAGDKLVLTIDAQGKGKGIFTVQALNDKKWLGFIGIKNFPLAAAWQKSKIEFQIKDVKKDLPTDNLFIHFGIAKDSEILIRSVSIDVVSDK